MDDSGDRSEHAHHTAAAHGLHAPRFAAPGPRPSSAARWVRALLGRVGRIGTLVTALWLVLAPVAGAVNTVDGPVLAPPAVSTYQTYYNAFGDP